MTLTLTPTLTLIPDDNANHLSTHHSLGHKIRLGVVRREGKKTKAGKAGILTAIIMGRLVRWGRPQTRARADSRARAETQVELVIEVLYVDPAGRRGALGLHIGKALVAVMACVALRAGGPSTLVSLGVGLRDQRSTAAWWKQLGLPGGGRQPAEVALSTLLSNVWKFRPHSDLTSMLTTQSSLAAQGEGGEEEEVAIEEEEEEEDKTDDKTDDAAVEEEGEDTTDDSDPTDDSDSDDSDDGGGGGGGGGTGGRHVSVISGGRGGGDDAGEDDDAAGEDDDDDAAGEDDAGEDDDAAGEEDDDDAAGEEDDAAGEDDDATGEDDEEGDGEEGEEGDDDDDDDDMEAGGMEGEARAMVGTRQRDLEVHLGVNGLRVFLDADQRRLWGELEAKPAERFCLNPPMMVGQPLLVGGQPPLMGGQPSLASQRTPFLKLHPLQQKLECGFSAAQAAIGYEAMPTKLLYEIATETQAGLDSAGDMELHDVSQGNFSAEVLEIALLKYNMTMLRTMVVTCSSKGVNSKKQKQEKHTWWCADGEGVLRPEDWQFIVQVGKDGGQGHYYNVQRFHRVTEAVVAGETEPVVVTRKGWETFDGCNSLPQAVRARGRGVLKDVLVETSAEMLQQLETDIKKRGGGTVFIVREREPAVSDVPPPLPPPLLPRPCCHPPLLPPPTTHCPISVMECSPGLLACSGTTGNEHRTGHCCSVRDWHRHTQVDHLPERALEAPFYHVCA